ncbi:hypothetical protein RND81_12G007700 [Saponaria officinalis]|uniref:Uncharacterized protein n=1 Tax=Saponaria officinalis TaxID=3572 RepID=A0AAW1H6Z6_SAPOF
MDSHKATMKTDIIEMGKPENNIRNIPEDRIFTQDAIHSFTNDPKHGKVGEQKEAPQHSEPSGEVNMEAAINPDDVIRAGGFGATDGLSSALPMASDSTDFESSLLDMRDYEEPQGEKCRPGLGWSEDKELV